MYDPITIANFFINQSLADGYQLTPMKLVKLTYIAHGWHLAFKEKPLLSEGVQAWKFGPVVPTVYHTYKEFGRNQIPRLKPVISIFDQPIRDDSDEWKILKGVWNNYKHLTGANLSTMTHQSGTPWDTITKQHKGHPLPHNLIIPNDMIQKHYQELKKQRA